MLQTSPSTVPFVEYVLKVIEHPPHMFVAKLAACCTTLFLTRSDPHLLRSLCHKWAIRFSMDRKKLIRYIKERARQAPGKPDYRSGSDSSSSSSDEDDEDDEDLDAEPESRSCSCEDAANGPVPSSKNASMTKNPNAKPGLARRQLKFCDPEKAEEHFLSILNSLVPLYFSWNWHRTEHVIKMNKEHELYIRENVLPICIAVPAADGVDDEETALWLCPPRSFLDGCSEAGPNGSPTQSINQFFMGTSTQPHSASRLSSDIASQAGQGPTMNSDELSPTTPAPSWSPTVTDANRQAGAGGGLHGLALTTPSDRSAVAAASPTRRRQGSSLYVVQPPSSRLNASLDIEPSLTLMTLSNYKTILTSSPNGTVMIFHAEYSMKSNDLLQMIQDIVQKGLLDPMPTVAVVYTVTEPELSALYDIKWLPTIIYTPPTAESAFDAAVKSTHSIDSDAAAKLEPHTPNSSGHIVAGTPSAMLQQPQPQQQQPGLFGSPQGVHAAAAHGLITGGDESSSTQHGSPTPLSSPNTAVRSPTPATDDGHRDPKSAVSSMKTTGASSTFPRASSIDGAFSTRNVSASTNAATNAATQLLYGIDFDKRRRKQGGSPLDQPFASPVSNSGRSFDVARLVAANDAGPTTPLSTLDSLENTGHDSVAGASTPVDELMSFVEMDGHNVYPVNGVTTANALVEWINSRGTAQPRLKKMKEFVTRVSAIRTEQKFKQFRELHSAVVMLRRLQSGDASPSSGAASRNEPPLFIFLGGGMAAGKSTAAMALAHSPWWRNHKDSSVLVNADEFKVADPLYETQHPDVHARSTRAAENLLVQAVNQGRSIVFDGTMMWKPFVEQVVSMVRNAHTTLYRQGPGYLPEQKIEEYFQVSKKRPSPLAAPYKIILLGITVEPEIAVPRGFLRKFSTGRGVPISTQLKSFKYFAQNFDDYISLVDRATLYNNNVFVDLSKGELPPVLAEMADETPRELHVFDNAAYQLFLKQRTVNVDADNILELYPNSPGNVF